MHFLNSLVASDDTVLVDQEKAADLIIQVSEAPSYSPNRRWRPGNAEKVILKDTKPVLAWNCADHPTGYLPGFYCSLARALFNSSIHSTACYPICYNELVEQFDQSDAHVILGFHGGFSSPVRKRIFELLQQRMPAAEVILKQQSGPWQMMTVGCGMDEKKAYVDTLRRSKFFLCPKGNGVGSIRLFETLKTGRVPVIVSDDYVLPSHIDWTSCALRVRERQIADIPDLVRANLDRWPELARNARKVWEDNFSENKLLQIIGRESRHMASSLPMSTWGLEHRLRLYSFVPGMKLKLKTGRIIYALRQKLRKKNKATRIDHSRSA